MPTPIGHGLFALALHFAAPESTPRRRFYFFLLLLIAALAPDFDYYPILWGDFQLANLNHQGFTHSLIFCLIAAVPLSIFGAWLACGPALRLYPWLATAAVSHVFLDYLTFDGRAPYGIPIFWPFTDERFNSPVSLFGGAIKGSLADLFSVHNAGVALREILWLGIPVVLVWFFVRRQRRAAKLIPGSGKESR